MLAGGMERKGSTSLALSKVKKHPYFKDRDPKSQQTIAEELIDPGKVKERFAHLLEVDEYVESIKESDACELTHSLEYEKRKDQQKMDAAMAAYLPVKLSLSKLRRGVPPGASRFATLLRFAFGPLHAKLVVGNICIEWDDSSLVTPMPAPSTPGDFEAGVSGASWQDDAKQVPKDMSMANQQNMDTPQKLGIIYRFRDQKERLINDLVDVIVEYNRRKRYGVFRCNCQDFVKDALNALRIHKELKFDGSLGVYFNTLKRGVVANSDFGTHHELDEYVQAHMETVGKREMEYWLCLYFQFHTAEIKLLSPEEQEAWECPILACMCDKLDRRIDHESLCLHTRQDLASPHDECVSFSRAPVVGSHRASVMPTTQPLLEEEEEGTETDGVAQENGGGTQENGGDENPEFLARQYKGGSVRQQAKKLSQRSGYSKRVLVKLQVHPKYRDMGADSLLDEADTLSEREQFRMAYFASYIHDRGMNLVLEASEEETQADGQNLSPGEVRRRANERYEKLFNVDMNLIIRAPSRRSLKTRTAKAPVSACLQVGYHVFEWNESNLVIPRSLDEIAAEPQLLSPVHPASNWCDVVQDVKGDVEQSITESVESKDYSMQIKLHYKVTQKKDQLLSAFIDTVLKFNRDKHYSWLCNNQTFLTEAMKSLGIQTPPKLSTNIADHIRQLKPRPALYRKQINDHKDLDAVALEAISGDLSKADIEFLIAKYFLFHVSGWERKKEDAAEGPAETWECSVPECKQPELTTMLQRRTSISSDPGK